MCLCKMQDTRLVKLLQYRESPKCNISRLDSFINQFHRTVITISSFGFSKDGLKAQWSTQPRASEATPWVSRVGAVAPCKGKSFNPLCFYSYLIADLAVLKWNIVCIFCSTPAPCLKAFALTGRDCSNTRYPGCRFACPGLCSPLGFQPALAKSES